MLSERNKTKTDRESYLMSFDLYTQAHKCMHLHIHMYIHNTHLLNSHTYTYMHALTLQKNVI